MPAVRASGPCVQFPQGADSVTGVRFLESVRCLCDLARLVQDGQSRQSDQTHVGDMPGRKSGKQNEEPNLFQAVDLV